MHDEVGFYHLGILSASVFKFQSIQKWFWASSLSPPVCLETSVSLLWLHKLSLTFIAACSFGSAWIQIGRWCKTVYLQRMYMGVSKNMLFRSHLAVLYSWASSHWQTVCTAADGKAFTQGEDLNRLKKNLTFCLLGEKRLVNSPCEEAPFTADERRVQLTSSTSGSSHLRQHNS